MKDKEKQIIKMETWQPVKGYENLYEVSNYGTRLERLSKTRGKKVNQYDLDGNYIQTFYSVNYAEKITKIKHIYDCCNGKLKTAGKYVWRYEQ